MALKSPYIEDVCKMGQGEETCSFLGMGQGGFRCLKGTELQAIIEARRAAGVMGAKGDNCQGDPDARR